MSIRRVHEEELSVIWRWTVAEGWNLALRDLHIYYYINPEGWLAVEHDQKLAGCITGYLVGNRYKFIGMVIVKPEARGKGLAKTMLTAVTEYLQLIDGDTNVALDSVPHLTGLYSKFGFTVSSFEILQFTGHPKLDSLPDSVPNITFSAKEPCVRHLGDIQDYDSRIHPCKRTTYWTAIASYPEVTCVVAKQDGAVVGFGCIQPVVTGYRVAPLYADTVAVAKCLFKKLCIIDDLGTEGHPGNTTFHPSPLVVVDSFSYNKSVKFFSEECLLAVQPNSLVRMYSKQDIGLPWPKLYSSANTDVHIV